MYCQRLVTLFAASLTVTPIVLATPGFRFVKGGVTNTQGGLPSGFSRSSNSPAPSNPTSNQHSTGKAHRLNSYGRGCATIVDIKVMAKVEKSFNKSRRPSKSAKAGPINFPVHWHVIAANETEASGWISDEQIHAQMDVMNEAFDLAGFGWDLVNITRTINAEWFTKDFDSDTPLEKEIITSSRQGDAATLNVWSANIKDFGWGRYPWRWEVEPEIDGVVIQYGTVPGGLMEEYNQGFTLVHEAGHWLGLYHTFEGESCDGPGDYVSDTPQQSVKSESCEPSDSCTGLPGGDPYTNFMDYSPDACLSEFTTGQIRRMREEIRTYRGLDDA
ncbi:metalloprotease [Coprinopsis sp. MPI-PUGE-AT-0042]|nr:metalloprotease [Coprinopsis sp. MPI-PUGE-AT-0042]